MDRFEGRTAVVTGAASGIGLAVAEALAAEGMQVVMTDIDAGSLDGHVTRLRDSGATVHPIVVDVRDPDAVDGAGEAAVERFGGLHVAVNNAGIVNRGYSWELGLDEWHRVLDVNLWGVIHGVRGFVPRILATGEEDGHPFLALEFLPGGSLAARVSDGPLRLEETLRVVAEVAAGLDALHRAGIVHRDVKPSNVMLREDGSAALTDFGLAKGAAYTLLTRPGQVLGTLDYLAPELVRGGEATPASDMYALGCVAFECLAGHAPFADRSLFGVGTAHLEDDPPDPPASPELARALLRALEKDPAARPPTATMYAHLLRAASRS